MVDGRMDPDSPSPNTAAAAPPPQFPSQTVVPGSPGFSSFVQGHGTMYSTLPGQQQYGSNMPAAWPQQYCTSAMSALPPYPFGAAALQMQMQMQLQHAQLQHAHMLARDGRSPLGPPILAPIPSNLSLPPYTTPPATFPQPVAYQAYGGGAAGRQESLLAPTLAAAGGAPQGVSSPGPDGEGKEVKRKRKTTKEGEPKKPPTCFMNFIKKNRARVREEKPGLKVTEVTKVLAEEWKELGTEGRREYKEAVGA
ncbi:hypothetical protein T484DRAFT_1887122 [Baffinella frigidus]|nr:hypothetical protein T484DRAFT_1887122 [Cryptophyta sp. CCMP2293]